MPRTALAGLVRPAGQGAAGARSDLLGVRLFTRATTCAAWRRIARRENRSGRRQGPSLRVTLDVGAGRRRPLPIGRPLFGASLSIYEPTTATLNVAAPVTWVLTRVDTRPGRRWHGRILLRPDRRRAVPQGYRGTFSAVWCGRVV